VNWNEEGFGPTYSDTIQLEGRRAIRREPDRQPLWPWTVRMIDRRRVISTAAASPLAAVPATLPPAFDALAARLSAEEIHRHACGIAGRTS
jgi:hypothetical protein